MNKHGSLLVLFAGLVSTAVVADDTVDRTIDAAKAGYIDISNTAGEVNVTGWSKSQVRVQGRLGEDVEELIVERNGDEITIKVKVPHRHRGDISADLDIHVPERSSIEVSAVSADITVNSVLGEQSLQTVSGDVDTGTAEKDVEAASVSGDVTIKGSGKEADTEASTVSGDVILIELAGRIYGESVSGDLEVRGGSFEEAHLETVNGDLDFIAELRRGGDLSLESVNGTVNVEFATPVSARIDIETFNGSIRNCFGPKPERTSRYSPGLELGFTEGDGDGRVDIETLNGSVNICNK